MTGHARSENSAPVAERYRWEVLSDPSQTLVVYMGLSTLPQFADGLLQAGLDASTPAVAVQDGTTATQRVVAAPLGGTARPWSMHLCTSSSSTTQKSMPAKKHAVVVAAAPLGPSDFSISACAFTKISMNET